MLSKIEAFFLGLIQGLTEFLPISSTGHLFLGRQFFGLQNAGLFLDTMLHIGTLLAVLVIYKNELVMILKNPFHKLSFLLAIGTIPAVIVGLLFEDYFDAISKTGVTLGWEFMITGAILWFSDSIRNGAKKMEDITIKDAVFIGTFQAAAIFPALSRSGLTIAAGLFRKLDRETAAYFSFFLSIPAIFGGILLQSKELFAGTIESISLSSLLVGTISSALFGYFAIVTMLHILKKKSLKIFAVYVWVLGGFVLTLQAFGIM
ncbi:undecaprenyl-diphosphate phosphatase [Bacillus oleivorans]|uniref:undecaprenyl-diphosphate phosphatase n=1 Tax=Bacillus oleivorans TaxID=1448271 RepID=UPI0015CAF111|nr:undecaprenyl-diphosphate phosphatase [Bacillus oleivorans]